MSINLKNPEAEQLLKELAAATGESLTDAAKRSFSERLERVMQQRGSARKRQLASLLDLIAEAREQEPLDRRPLKVISDELWGD